VKIQISLNGTQCEYIVENSKAPKGEVKSGIGLQNVKRRLELSNPGKYQLTIEDKPDTYRVKLNLNLS
jgi:sensor histidine kinase YesM